MNMKKVAELAGVSTATVSRVINGSAPVSDEIAARVRRVVKKLDFVPDPHATTLKYGRSRTYGVIIPDLANPYFLEFIKGFESLLADNNQECLIANTDFHTARMQQSIRRMLLRRVEGVALLASESESESFETSLHKQIPVVTSDRRKIADGLSDVSIDFEGGLQQAVHYLKQLGHSEIGFIGGTAGLVTSKIRQRSFMNALKKCDLTYNKDFVVNGDYRLSGGEAAARKILSLPRRPTALLTANDMTAFGVLREFHRSGVRVPEEISLVGFDDLNISDIVNPPLTTLRIPQGDLAKVFFNALEEMHNDVNTAGKQYTIPTTLIVRDSTGRAPQRTSRKTK